MKRTPNLLEVLLHYHVSPDPHPRIDAPAVQGAIDAMLHEGILQSDLSRDSQYALTERGEVWLKMLLDTPLPIRLEVWVDPRCEPSRSLFD